MTSVYVITAVRNRVDTIDRCLASVDDPHAKRIVVDGASSDGTAARIAQRATSLFWWCSEADGGIAAAFNKGLAQVPGGIVGILNADDWYEPGAIDLVRRAMARTGAEVVHGRVRYWRDGQVERIAEGDHRALRRGGSINHPSVFVQAAVYRRLGGFDPTYRYAMDYEIMLRWLKTGVRFLYVPRVIANMSLGGVSDVHRMAALAEVRRAQRTHLGIMQADRRYLELCARYRLRQLCDRSGLQRLVAWHRRIDRGMRTIAPG